MSLPIAVCSRNLERARDFAAKHGAERAYDSLEKMLEDPELDILYITTPNSLHAQQTMQAAEAGRHVLCEKPMALTVHDAELMIQACNRIKVKLGVCYDNRYHPAHVEAYRCIQSSIVGNINVARVQYCRVFSPSGWRNDLSMAGAGALMGQGVHCVDLLPYLLDSEVTEVRALTDEEPPHRLLDEMVYAILKFDKGVHGIVLSGLLAPRSDNDAVLYGSKAKVTCKGTVGRLLGNLGELLVEGDSLNMSMTFTTDEPLLAKKMHVIEAFNKWVEEDSEPYISGDNGLQMVRITNAILESSHKKKAIKIIRQF